MAPMLEFPGGKRAPFPIDRAELIIGRGADCPLRLDSNAAAERHARVTVDIGGNVFIQDLDTHSGTLRNGNYVYGVQQLVEGDQVEIGGVTLVFRARALEPAAPPVAAAPPRVDVAPRRVDAAPVAAARAGADERTRMPVELPPEVRAALAARDAQQAATPAPAPRTTAARATTAQPPPPVEAGPAGIVVGTPEPEPDNFRTVQMQAADLAALGIDPASLPPIAKPQPAAAKRTMMGMPAPVVPGKQPPLAAPSPSGLGYMATTELPAQGGPVAPRAPQAQATPQQATMMAQAPQLPSQPVQPQHATPQPATMMAQAPQLPSQPQHATPQQATMMAQAPQLPSQPMTPQLPSQPYPPQLQAQPYPPQAQPYPQAPPMKTMPLAAPVMPVTAPELTEKTTPLPMPVVAAPKKTQPHAGTHLGGALSPFSRALAFMGQIFTLARQHKALLKPLVWDVLLTTPVMAAFTVLQFFVHSSGAFYACLGAEAFALYFIDYASNSITASLMYDYATTGEATMESALPRVKHALPGILTFAGVSALLDVASTYARERNDLVAKIALRILRAIWTTATYVIMPALVIEGVSFGAAFKRSKQLMDHDPTGVGAGIVAMSITSYIVAIVCYPLAYVVMRALGYVHPAIGALGGMLIVNLYWAVSGWMKIAYSTCFYLWARECERTGSTDHSLAPAPLRTALEAA